MTEIILILFVTSAGVLTFTSIQAVMSKNTKTAFVFLSLVFLSIAVCLFLLGKFFTAFAVLFFMFINQYIFKYLSEKDSQHIKQSESDNSSIKELIENKQTEENSGQNDEITEMKARNLLISTCLFILLTGLTSYISNLSFSQVQTDKNLETQTVSLLWFSVFIAILAVLYFLLLLFSYAKHSLTKEKETVQK